MTSNVFARFDLGGGPVFYSGPAGMIFQTGVHFGAETYFTKWFGVGFSYGWLFEYGKETLWSGNPALSFASPQYRDATLWNRGQVFMVTLKSAFF